MSKVFNMVGGGGGPYTSIFVTGLSETDTVTAVHKKTVQVPNPDCIVPKEYTQLEYIYCDNSVTYNNGIITNIPFNTVTSIVLNIELTSLPANDPILFRNATTENYPYIGFGAEGIKTTEFGITATSVPNYTKTQLLNNGLKTCTIYISGVTATGSIAFGYWGDEHFSSSWKCDKLIFYSNDIEVGNYVPVKRDVDNAIGMYDLVSNTFFANAGTGSFTAGLEVPKYIDIVIEDKTLTGKWKSGPEVPQTIDGFLIKPICDLGTWTVTATDGINTATQDVLVDVITDYEIEMSLSA